MWLTLCYRSGYALVASVVMFCSDVTTEKDKDRVEKRVEEKGVVLLASMPRKVTAGSEANLRITVTNNGQTSLRYKSDGFGNYSFATLELSNSKGDAVLYTRFGSVVNDDTRDGSASVRLLKPGHKIEVNLNLSRLYDLSEPGEYNLRINRSFNGVPSVIDKLPVRVVDEK